MQGNGHPPVNVPVPLIAPKQSISLRHVFQDGPSAHPVQVPGVLPIGDGVQAIATFGGLTKVEALAGQIAGHCLEVALRQQNVVRPNEDAPSIPDAVATNAVDIAEAILVECKRRQEAAQQPAAT